MSNETRTTIAICMAFAIAVGMFVQSNRVETQANRILLLESRITRLETQVVINHSDSGDVQSRVGSLERMAEIRYQTVRALQDDIQRMRLDVIRTRTHVTIPAYDTSTPPHN